MNCVVLRVSSSEENSQVESPLTMIAVPYGAIKKLQDIFSHMDLDEQEEPIKIKSEMIDHFWVDFIDNYVDCSEKVTSDIERIVEEEAYCTEYDLDIEDGIEVESSRILMDKDGIYFACEYEGETYCSTILDHDIFDYLESIQEESELEAEET